MIKRLVASSVRIIREWWFISSRTFEIAIFCVWFGCECEKQLETVHISQSSAGLIDQLILDNLVHLQNTTYFEFMK